MKPRVLISVLNWNRASRTRACLVSLREAGYLGRADVRVVVTDNGSHAADATDVQGVAAEFSAVVRCNVKNLGFAGGHNAVMQQAIDEGIDFVWLINNDALVPPGTLEALLVVADAEPRSGALSPCLAYEDTREVYFAGAVQDWRALGSLRCETPWNEDFHRRHQNDIWALGTALLLRTAALAQVGPLNAELFAYFEDDELGERLRLHGWRSVMVRDAVVFHNSTTELAERRPLYFYYLFTRNWYWFYRQHAPAGARRLIGLRLTATAVERAAVLRRAGEHERAKALLLGLCDGQRAHLGPPDRLDRPLSRRMRAMDGLLRIANGLHARLRSAKATPRPSRI